MSLVVLVVVGTLIVTLIGAALFLWLAWLLSRQPAPLRGNSGWWDWFQHLDGAGLFDAARTTATILAVVGVGGAALVAYRRQDTAERSHRVSIDSQRIATDQLDLDSKKYQLDRDRHQLEVGRRNDDLQRELHARFATVAEQLGSGNYAVRHAGVYALASLADDWQRLGNSAERQVCVHLLCAQLRRPRPTSGLPGEQRSSDSPEQDWEVRKTIVALIRSHRPANRDVPDNWKSCTLDLSGADLSRLSFTETDLSSANLDDAILIRTNLIRADLSNAMMSRAELPGADFSDADLTNARLFSVHNARTFEGDSFSRQAVFGGANLQGAYLTSATLPNAEFDRADLRGAMIHNAELVEASFVSSDLTDAQFVHSDRSKANFTNANVSGTNFTDATVSEATFERARHNAQTNWANGIIPSGVAPLTKVTAHTAD